jgi:hypothetical protein
LEETKRWARIGAGGKTYCAIVTILDEKTSVRTMIDNARRTFREMKTTPDGREGKKGVILGDIAPGVKW